MILGRHDKALTLYRMIYARAVKAFGTSHKQTLSFALNLAMSLCLTGNFTEAISFLRPRIIEAKKALGPENRLTLMFCASLAQDLFLDDGASPEQLREAVEILERTVRTGQRVLGGQHPQTIEFQESLSRARREALERG